MVGGIRRCGSYRAAELVKQDDVVPAGERLGQLLNHVALKQGFVQIHVGDPDGIPPHSGEERLLVRIHPYQVHENGEGIVVIPPEKATDGVIAGDAPGSEKLNEKGILSHEISA
jgi:hypothetical protein